MERNEGTIEVINCRIIENSSRAIEGMKKINPFRYGYDKLIHNAKIAIRRLECIINSCEAAKDLEKPKYKEGSYYWVNDGGTWKPARRGYKTWHFINYAAREEDVDEVGEEITRN